MDDGQLAFLDSLIGKGGKIFWMRKGEKFPGEKSRNNLEEILLNCSQDNLELSWNEYEALLLDCA